MVGKVVDDGCGHYIYKEAHKSGISVDKYEYRKVNTGVKCNEDIGHTEVAPCQIIYLFDDDIRKNLGAVDASAVSKDQRKPCAKDRSAENDRNEMLDIKFKGDHLEHFKAGRIERGAHDSLYTECFSEDKRARDDEGRKHNRDAHGKIKTAQLVDDDGDTGGAVIDGIIGYQYADDGKARH